MPQRTFTGNIAHVTNTCLGALGVSISKLPLRSTLEHHIKTLLRTLEIDCVIDIGAHFGEFGSTIRALGYTGQLVSFEPAQDSFRLLKAQRGEDKAWQLHMLAMGSAEETKDLFIYSQTDFNSLHAPSDLGTSSRFRGYLQTNRSERVEVRRLDSVLPDLLPDLFEKNVYLKIDTQGHDLAVFEGAEGILSRVKALQIELPSMQLYQEVPAMEDALLRYREGGFLPTGFFPVTYDADQVTVVEWDCVLARRNVG